MMENIRISFRNRDDPGALEDDVVSNRKKQDNGSSDFKTIHVENRKERLTIGGSEFLFLVGNRLYYSTAYKFLYFSMILLNIAILIYLVLDPNSDAQTPLFFCFEILITALLAIEIGIKLLAQNRSYWSRPSNWFDFCVLVLCVASLILFSQVQFSEAEHVDELMATVLLAIRYAAQALRLVVLLKHKKRLIELTAGIGRNTVDDIDFTLIDPDLDVDRFTGRRRGSTLSHDSALSAGNDFRNDFGSYDFMDSRSISFPKLARNDSNSSSISEKSTDLGTSASMLKPQQHSSLRKDVSESSNQLELT